MSHERRPSFSGVAGRPKSRGWRPLSRSMVRGASPALKSGDEAALAALRSPPATRTVAEHAAVRRWSERSVRLPGGTTHEELCTVMTLEEHPPHSLLFRQGTPGDASVAKSCHRPHRAAQGRARPRTAAHGHARSYLTATGATTRRQHRRAALLGCRRLPASLGALFAQWRLRDGAWRNRAQWHHTHTSTATQACTRMYMHMRRRDLLRCLLRRGRLVLRAGRARGRGARSKY
jgi:hypothetical protein